MMEEIGSKKSEVLFIWICIIAFTLLLGFMGLGISAPKYILLSIIGMIIGAVLLSVGLVKSCDMNTDDAMMTCFCVGFYSMLAIGFVIMFQM